MALTKEQIHRLYFEIAPDDGIQGDIESLQSQLTSAKFQINIKDDEISNLTKESQKYKKQASLLKKDLLKLHQYETAVDALKEQVKHLRKENDHCQQYKEEVKQLKNELTNFSK